MEKVISEKTLIPISLVMTIVTGVSWATNIYSKTVDHQDAIEELEKNQDKLTNIMISIDKRLSRIEWKLGIK